MNLEQNRNKTNTVKTPNITLTLLKWHDEPTASSPGLAN